MLLPLNVIADDSEWMKYAWLGLSTLNFNYEEYDDHGASLDSEQGILAGIIIGARAESEHYFAEADFRWSSGSVDYTSAAINSVTDENILDIEIDAGAWLYDSDSQRVGILAGLGTREWRRDIHSTQTASGLDETYRWGYWVLGLRGQQVFNGNLHVEANLQLTRTINPYIDVHFKNAYDDTRLALGEANGYRASLEVSKHLANNITLALQPWYEYWKLGRSADAILFTNGVLSGTVFEPRSTTGNYGVNISVSWEFGGN